nr:MAG TPA: hypothetical protein [Caudoviricetes sp.]
MLFFRKMNSPQRIPAYSKFSIAVTFFSPFSRIILLGFVCNNKLSFVNRDSISRKCLDEFAEKKIIMFVFYRLHMSVVFFILLLRG